MYLFLDILSTFVAYTIVPFIIFFKQKDNFDNKTKNIILILNSIIISILFISLRIYLKFDDPIRTFTPAFLYYFINIAIWNKTSTKKDNFKKNKNSKRMIEKINIKTISIYIIPLLLTILCLVYILIFNNNINNKLDTSYMEDNIIIPTYNNNGMWTSLITSKGYITEIKNLLIINNYILITFIIINILTLSFIINYIIKNKQKNK